MLEALAAGRTRAATQAVGSLRYLHQQIQSKTQTLTLTHLLAEDKASALSFTAARSWLPPAGLLQGHSW